MARPPNTHLRSNKRAESDDIDEGWQDTHANRNGDNRGDQSQQKGEWKSKTASILYKTKMCTFFSYGMCNKGLKCPYAHDPAELNSTPDLYQTKLCKNMLTGGGRCNDSNCRFAHTVGDIRTFHRSSDRSFNHTLPENPQNTMPFQRQPQEFLEAPFENPANPQHTQDGYGYGIPGVAEMSMMHESSDKRALHKSQVQRPPEVSDAQKFLPPLPPQSLLAPDPLRTKPPFPPPREASFPHIHRRHQTTGPPAD